jgi:putative aldouronate transport system substrate-binding protein
VTDGNKEATSRRQFLSLASAGVAGLIAACSAPAAAPPAATSNARPLATTAPAGAAAGAASAPTTAASTPAAASAAAPAAAAAPTPGAAPRSSPALPNYFPLANGPKADYHSPDPRVTDGFDNYPTPYKSWTKEPPGTGSTVNVYAIAYYPPPTPYDQNPTWHEVNKQLNANVQMTIFAGADNRVKFPTIMASNDLPDLMHIFLGITNAPAGTTEFIKAQCADLTPYLGGDAIKDYPNLAAIPTYAWQNSLSVIDGKLYQWPIHRYLPGAAPNGGYFFKNDEVYDTVIGKDYVPKDSDDLKRVMKELTRPQEGVWAIGNIATLNYGLPGYLQMFGAPNVWQLDSSGKLTRAYETEAYKAAVGYLRDVVASGYMWADAPGSTDSRSNLVAGKFIMSVEGFGNSWNDFWRRGLTQVNPPRHFNPLSPFRATAGDKPVSFLTPGGYSSSNVMKKASPDRIRELLRILDWLASPFGSQEDLLLTYGLSGQDFNMDDKGNPLPTTQGNVNAGYVPWRYLSQHPYVQYQSDLPNYASISFKVEQELVSEGILDPTVQYFSKTQYASTGIQATQTFSDAINEIILGHRPLSDYDGLVQSWRSSAGDQVRKELLDAMAAG